MLLPAPNEAVPPTMFALKGMSTSVGGGGTMLSLLPLFTTVITYSVVLSLSNKLYAETLKSRNIAA